MDFAQYVFIKKFLKYKFFTLFPKDFLCEQILFTEDQ